MAKIGIVDTNCTEYAKALTGVVVTSLNVGTTMFTVFLDFNANLANPFTSQRLHVQVHLKDHNQRLRAIVATLHYQMVYKLQDRACDLHLPNHTEKML